MLAFRLESLFFGQICNREHVLEEFFLLQMHLNMSYIELRNMPVRYRRWYLERLTKHFKQKNEAQDKARAAAKIKRDSRR